MSKRTTINNITNHIENVNLEIDYDKLAQAIVKAQIEANNLMNEKEIEDEKRSEISQQRKDYLKEKDYSSETNLFFRILKTFINRLCVFIRILFIPKKKIVLFTAIDSLITSFTSILFAIIKFVLYVFAILFIIGIFYDLDITLSLPFALVCFVFAQLFRIAQYEVDRIKNRDYILALFVGILTVFSLIISVIK